MKTAKILWYNMVVVLLVTNLMSCSKDQAETLPIAPAGLAAAVTATGDVRLNWSYPDISNLKEYSLSYQPDGVPRVIDKDSLSALITHLQYGKTYTFSLRARDNNNLVSEAATIEVIVGKTTDTVHSTLGVYTGDLTLATQNDVNMFANKYHRVDGKVIISGATITNLLPLATLDTVDALEIYFNDSLTSLTGLNQLKFVGGNLYVRDNKQLKNLNGFNGLTTIDKDFILLGNNNITHLDGFSNLKLVNGTVYIGVEAWKTPPKAKGNTNLANFCGLKALLVSGGLKGGWFVENNLTNPSKQELLDNCP